MMYHRCNVLEQPLVRAISDEMYVLALLSAQIRPTPRDDGPNSHSIDRVKNGCIYPDRILKHNTTKANIYRWGTRRYKDLEISWSVVCWGVTKEKTADI